MDQVLHWHLQLGHALLEGLVGLNRHLPQLRHIARALLAHSARLLQLVLQRVSPACRGLLSLPAQPSAWSLFLYIPQLISKLIPRQEAPLLLPGLVPLCPQTG